MKNILKKSACLLLVFLFVFSVAACGKKDKTEQIDENTTNSDYYNSDSSYQNDKDGFSATLGKITLTDFSARLAENAISFTFSSDNFNRISEEGAETEEYSMLLKPANSSNKIFSVKLLVDAQTQYITSCDISGLLIGSSKGVDQEKKALFKQVTIAAIRAFTGKSTKQALDVYNAFGLNDDSNFSGDISNVQKTIDGCVYTYSTGYFSMKVA